MYLRTSEIRVLKYTNFKKALKKAKVKLDLLTDSDILIMVEKDIR